MSKGAGRYVSSSIISEMHSVVLAHACDAHRDAATKWREGPAQQLCCCCCCCCSGSGGVLAKPGHLLGILAGGRLRNG